MYKVPLSLVAQIGFQDDYRRLEINERLCTPDKCRCYKEIKSRQKVLDVQDTVIIKALLDSQGPASPGDIHKMTGIPRTTVYDRLKRLEQKDLPWTQVVVYSKDPLTYGVYKNETNELSRQVK
jgi:predicted transcriptional regulator